MAYTADLDSTHNPATGTVPPASWGDLINANFADMGAWTSYTPTWTASSSNPSIGDGSLSGVYQRRDKFVVFRVRLVWGSTTSAGSGTWIWATPATFTDHVRVDGQGMAYDSGSVAFYPLAIRRWGNATVAALTLHDRAAVTNAAPVTWATGDTLSFTGFLELA